MQEGNLRLAAGIDDGGHAVRGDAADDEVDGTADRVQAGVGAVARDLVGPWIDGVDLALEAELAQRPHVVMPGRIDVAGGAHDGDRARREEPVKTVGGHGAIVGPALLRSFPPTRYPSCMTALAGRKPDWLRVRFPTGGGYERLRDLMREQELHTVCEEARCPNIGDCWNRGTATFMILGDTCTRACGFCAVTSGRPGELDRGEPKRVALAVQRMGLRHAVITSVNRDDVSDGGAGIFAETIRWTRRLSPGTTIEVLIPDFMGDWDALQTVLDAAPEILNHNTETVPRLYGRVRPKAKYERSLELLQRAKAAAPDRLTKSGLMTGLGETHDELLAVFADLRSHDVDILTLGQYPPPHAEAPSHRSLLPPRRVRGARRGRPQDGLRPRRVGPAGAQLLPRRGTGRPRPPPRPRRRRAPAAGGLGRGLKRAQVPFAGSGKTSSAEFFSARSRFVRLSQ